MSGRVCPEAVIRARELLESVTPMRADCGRTCGGACCRDPEDGQVTGMELFPGEEALYPRRGDWFKIYHGGRAPVFVCRRACPRGERPLSCRIFPLTYRMNGGTLRAVMDRRAAGMCPLYVGGERALLPAFREAVLEAGRILMEDDTVRPFVEALCADAREADDAAAALAGKLGG